MKHLTDPQLNGYLDNVLTTPEREQVEAHLSECADCRAEMDSLLGVFRALEAMPEQALPHDLIPAVLSQLPEQRKHLGWKLVIAVQAGVALGLIILVVTNLLEVINLQEWAATFTVEIPSVALRAPSLPPLPFTIQLPTANVVFLAISAFLLWSVGNATFLGSRPEVKK